MMMNKKKSLVVYSAKYLLVLPLTLALVAGNVACGAQKTSNNDADRQSTKEIVLKQNDEPKILENKENVFMKVDQMPEFPGGEAEMMKYVSSNLRYPIEAQKAGAQGRVMARFVVTETGEITDVEIVRNNVEFDKMVDQIVLVDRAKDGSKIKKKVLLSDIKKLIDEESIRVVNGMPKWNAGVQNGKAVSVYFILPLSFKLK